MIKKAFKVALRARIPILDGQSDREALKFFKEKLGEPTEIDNWVTSIFYTFRPGGFYAHEDQCVGMEPFYEAIHSDNLHYIDLVIQISNGDLSTSMSLEDIQARMEEMAEKFEIEKDSIKLICISWNTTMEEPITV